MEPPETALEKWLAREGWNQIDRGGLKARARNRLILCGAAVILALTLLWVTGELESLTSVWGITASVLFAAACAAILISAIRSSDSIDELCGPLTSSGRSLLTQVLKQVVGGNNSLRLEPGMDPPPSAQMVQNSVSTALSTEDLALLEPIFEQVNRKWALMERGDGETTIVEFALIGAGRAVFSLAADLRAENARAESARLRLRELKEIVAGFPTRLFMEDQASREAMMKSLGAWIRFKEQVQAG